MAQKWSKMARGVYQLKKAPITPNEIELLVSILQPEQKYTQMHLETHTHTV